MALLKHDAQGFLAGDPIDIGRALSIWDEIRRDVTAIRRAVGGLSSAPANSNVVSILRADAGKTSERMAQRTAPDRSRLAVVPKSNQAVTIKVDVQQQAARRQAAMHLVVAGGQRGARAIATPRQRNAMGRFVKSTATQDVVSAEADPAIRAAQEVQGGPQVAQDVRSVEAQQPKPQPQAAQQPERQPVGRGRDGRGQFTKGSDDSGGSGGGGDADRSPVTEGGFRTFFDRLSETIESTGNTAAEADPAIRAAQEVAQPLARGYQMLAGGGDRQDKRQEGWLRRIFASISGFRKDEMAAAKLAQRTLKDIADKPVDGADGRSGFWSGLLSAIAGIGPMIVAALLALLKKIPVVGPLLSKVFGRGGAAGAAGAAGATGAARGAAGVAKAGGMLGAAKGVLGKLPIIGALLSTVGAAADVYGSETDDQLSRKEKDQNAGKAVGGLAGTLGGAWAGASSGAALGVLGGPIGAAIGGVVGGVAGAFFGDQAGQVLGQTVGGWVGEMRQADIPGRISSAWVGMTTTVSEHWSVAVDKWDAVAKAVSSAWDGVAAAFTKVADGVSDAWGEFVSSANSGWDAFISLFRSAYDGLKSLPVIGRAIQAAEDAAVATTEAARAAKEKARAAASEAARVVKEKAAAVVDVVTGAPAAAANAAQSSAQWAAQNTTVGKGAVSAYQAAKPVVQQAAKTASSAADRAYNVTAATAGSALETIMPKGYRHKALFDGIKGGDSLTKYGTYTDEEAAKIRELKTSGANTSANVKGGMPIEIQDKIAAQAKKAGLDPVMMQKIAAMESGGNPNAVSATGASGLYQFVGQTASGVGIKNRFDVDQNIEGGMRLTRQNQSSLEKSGLPITAENLYMMHQLGPVAAKEVIRGAASGKLKSDMSPDTQKAMNLNYGAKSNSAADYIAINKKALDERYASVTKNTGAAQAAIEKTAPTVAALPTAATPGSGQATASQAKREPSLAATVQTVARSSALAAPVQTASAPAPVVPSFAPPPVATKAPDVVNPLGAGTESSKPITVRLPSSDVGQDVRDRRIAHIATGGIGG